MLEIFGYVLFLIGMLGLLIVLVYPKIDDLTHKTPYSVGYKKYEKPIISKKEQAKLDKFQELNIDFLKSKGVDESKVRFVFTGPCFLYSVKFNDTEPPYNIMFPVMSNGLFDNSLEPIDLNTDKSLIQISINTYKISDEEWPELIKQINSSERGFVFYLHEFEMIKDFHGNDFRYGSNVFSDRIRYVNLDEEVKKYPTLLD